MANRMFHQESYGMEPKPVSLYAVITIAASGAPTISRAKGVASISRTSAGLYVLTLQDTYQALLNFDVTVQSSTGIPDVSAGLKTNAVTTTGALTFQCAAPTNSSTTTLIAADPANGDTLFIQVNLSDSGAL